MKKLLNEVYINRHPLLKQIDNCFYKLQKKQDISSCRKELTKLIKEFTGIKHVYVSFKKDEFNAGIMPLYHWKLPKNSKEIKIPPIDETPKNINKIYVLFGLRLIDELNHRECTAILLHELGHCYYHFTNIATILEKSAKFLSHPLPTVITGFILNSFSAVMLLFVISRSLTILDHLQEYNCDEFAAKHGYLEEMATALNKISKFDKISPPKKNKFFRKVYSILFEILLNRTTHPNKQDRICNLVNKSKKEYINMYPSFKQELKVILSDLKC